MKKWTLLIMTVLLIFLSNDLVIASDSKAESNADALAGATAIVDASDRSVNDSKRPFTWAYPGTTGSYVYSGWPVEGTKWGLYYVPVYSTLTVDEIEGMKRQFQGSDIWPWNWETRIRSTPSAFGGVIQANNDPVKMTKYWPKAVAWPGDKVLYAFRVIGDPYWPDEIFLGLGYSEAKAKTNTRRVAIFRRTLRDGLTKGRSLGVGGSVAEMIDSGDGSVAFIGGAQFGNNRTKVEDYVELEILCMNDGPTEPNPDWFPKLEAKPVPVVEKKPEAKPCNPEPTRERIEKRQKDIEKCDRYCFDNLQLRNENGDDYYELYKCTGDQEALNEAIRNYEIAARNYRFGHDIKKNQVEADSIMAQVHENWLKAKKERKEK